MLPIPCIQDVQYITKLAMKSYGFSNSSSTVSLLDVFTTLHYRISNDKKDTIKIVSAMAKLNLIIKFCIKNVPQLY